MLFSFTKCNNASSDKLCSNPETRGKVISELMNNDTYMKEVMDSMRKKHPDYILSTVFLMSKDDKKMQANMMDNITNMCKVKLFVLVKWREKIFGQNTPNRTII